MILDIWCIQVYNWALLLSGTKVQIIFQIKTSVCQGNLLMLIFQSRLYILKNNQYKDSLIHYLNGNGAENKGFFHFVVVSI